MKKFFKISGLVILSIIALMLIAYLFIYLNVNHRMNKQYAFHKEVIYIPKDSAAIADGKHLAQIRGCSDCHGANFSGTVMMDNTLLGTISAPNLTRGKGGLPADFTIEDWMMSLRHGVNKQGRPLRLMPSQETTLFTEKDIADIIAYVQSLPPVNNVLPAIKPGPVVYVMSYLDKLPLLAAEKIDHLKPLTKPVLLPGSKEQGQYLSITCKNCHRPNMKGGDPLAPGFPPVPDISSTGAAGRITLQQFTTALRTGKKENGQQMSSDNMPWKMTAHYNDDEIKGLYKYLKSL